MMQPIDHAVVTSESSNYFITSQLWK